MSEMITSRKKYFIAAAALLLAIIVNTGCGRLKGEFAFRNLEEEAYRKIEGIPEFDRSRKINWVFVFKDVSGEHKVGVVLLKKELIWVDIDTRLENITETGSIIYGNIENLDEGNYKIMITEEGKVISEKEFTVFADEDPRSD